MQSVSLAVVARARTTRTVHLASTPTAPVTSTPSPTSRRRGSGRAERRAGVATPLTSPQRRRPRAGPPRRTGGPRRSPPSRRSASPGRPRPPQPSPCRRPGRRGPPAGSARRPGRCSSGTPARSDFTSHGPPAGPRPALSSRPRAAIAAAAVAARPVMSIRQTPAPPRRFRPAGRPRQASQCRFICWILGGPPCQGGPVLPAWRSGPGGASDLRELAAVRDLAVELSSPPILRRQRLSGRAK